jgi:hypothetical protein
MATPKMTPTAAIQKGMVGGREREKIKLVTKTAEVTGLSRLKLKRASVTIPKKKTTTIITKERQPKR